MSVKKTWVPVSLDSEGLYEYLELGYKTQAASKEKARAKILSEFSETLGMEIWFHQWEMNQHKMIEWKEMTR